MLQSKKRSLYGLFLLLTCWLMMLCPSDVYAGTVAYNISYSAVSTNYSDGSLPYGLSYAVDGDDIYCNLSVTNDTTITKATLRVYRNGSNVYSYTHSADPGRYFRYIAFPYRISGAGNYTIYYDIFLYIFIHFGNYIPNLYNFYCNQLSYIL